MLLILFFCVFREFLDWLSWGFIFKLPFCGKLLEKITDTFLRRNGDLIICFHFTPDFQVFIWFMISLMPLETNNGHLFPIF